MATDDFFRARLDSMIDLRHPLAVLCCQDALASHRGGAGGEVRAPGSTASGRGDRRLVWREPVEFGGGVSRAGRPRLPIRLMAGLLYLKNSFDLSDEELVQRWAENVY